MELAIINKYTVKKNVSMKNAQKEAKKYYGVTFGKAPKAKINKIVSIHTASLVASKENTLSQEEKERTKTYNVDSVIQRLLEVKLTGLSGDDFLTANKLEAFRKADVDKKYLIINGVECDPGLVHDGWLIRHKLGKIKKGIEVLRQCFVFEKVILASKMKLDINEDSFETKKVPNRYPMGYEKLLIQNVLGVRLSADSIPVQKGILVLNVQTVLAIGQIVLEDAKADNRYLTVADTESGEAVIVQAQVGSKVKDIIDSVYPSDSSRKVYTGGGVMLCHEAGADETVKLTTNFIGYGECPDYKKAQSCKHCGACVSKCPMGVMVSKVVQAKENDMLADCAGYHVDLCVGCGACTYVCSAQKDVRAIVAEAKDVL